MVDFSAVEPRTSNNSICQAKLTPASLLCIKLGNIPKKRMRRVQKKKEAPKIKDNFVK